MGLSARAAWAGHVARAALAGEVKRRRFENAGLKVGLLGSFRAVL